MTTQEKIWRTADGKAIPLEECTKDQLLARFRHVVGTHSDKLHEMNAARDALLKRCNDHRKAKALANARADRAETAMRTLLDIFTQGKVP
ncbi:hypothetical protein X766_15695 [Mesorhizobium sp. LSJC255A00]|uniref:hypothetical protein n=1 Tax=Mesorhizobium sp. LSJC255A00 TaxID=1287313 RepID=UPI0003CF30E8|nr:hypothetical protein [Mesorhizobium sp. LSJC255A00]ESX17854.1 hypothetical protein X766_15695 [Mesorhizobium sp. LSJC255A00]